LFTGAIPELNAIVDVLWEKASKFPRDCSRVDLIRVWQAIKDFLGSIEWICYDNNMINISDINHLVDTILDSE